jgi:hypothetical protein
MNKLLFVLLFCSVLTAKDFYVSPDAGVDGSGTGANPAASLARAVERAGKFIQVRGYPEEGITIYISDGVYELKEGVKIGPSLSGTKDAPIRIKPQSGGNPRIFGGPEFKLSEFDEVTDPDILERLHPDAPGKVLMLDLRRRGIYDYGQLPLYGHSMGALVAKTKYRTGNKAPELFFGEEPMTIARWPNEGYAEIGQVVEKGDIVRDWMDDRKGQDKFVPLENRNNPPLGFSFLFEDKERLKRWEKAQDLRLYGYWWNNWSDQAVEARVDANAGIIRSVQPSTYGVKKGQRFYAYNLLEELDKPGEWYLDRKSGVLYIIPPVNNPDEKVYLSLLEEPFIAVDGSSNLSIEGIEFGYTRGTGVTVSNSDNISIFNCRLGNTGGAGISINGGSSNAVIDCEVFNNGSGGISVGGGSLKDLTPSAHRVENCLIHNYARINKTYNPAIRLSGVGNIFRGSEVHNGVHVAVLFSGNNHLIEYNHIHDVCRETDDMAAIYSGRSWTSRGTVIRYNLIRDVTGFKAGTHRVSGIYLDDGISGITVEGNIFLNVAQGLMFNGGRDNTAVNNVFIDVENMMRSTNMREAFTTWAAGSWVTLNQNIKDYPINQEPWKSAYPNLATMLDDEPDLPKYVTIKDNLRFNAPMILGKAGIQDAVVEYGSVENNVEIQERPGGYNPVSGKFEFKESSGVFELMPGLKDIPTEKIGPIRDKKFTK